MDDDAVIVEGIESEVSAVAMAGPGELDPFKD